MNYSRKVQLLALVASCLLGWLSQPISRSSAAAADPKELSSVANLSGGLGRGVSLAALGGYRTLAANLVWVRMYSDWRYQMRPEVLDGIQLAVALNPDMAFFWIDGSRIIANDMPVWEVGEEQMNSLFETPEGIEVRKRYGREALAFLDQAPAWMDREFDVLKEKGVIHWRRLDDLPRAIDYFQRASALPGAPYYLARVCAELMVKQGDIAGALRYLETHWQTLPEDDPMALKGLVGQRILELRAQLASGQNDLAPLPEPSQ